MMVGRSAPVSGWAMVTPISDWIFASSSAFFFGKGGGAPKSTASPAGLFVHLVQLENAQAFDLVVVALTGQRQFLYRTLGLRRRRVLGPRLARGARLVQPS